MVDSPVSPGHFHSGVEQVLWRPALDRGALHRRALRSSVLPDAALYAVAGLATMVLSVLSTPVGYVALAAGCLLLAAAVVMARHDYRHWGHELGTASTVWRTDRGHGELYFRPADFDDQCASTATRIIDAVHAIHTGPAADWLDAEQLRELHHLAWEALAHMHQRPSAHRDRAPITNALALISTHIGLLNRQLSHIAATDTADAVLTRITAVHEVLDLRSRVTGAGSGTPR